jgi:DNA-binding NarL/FixJ family response regulator
VSNPGSRGALLETLQRLGYGVWESDDPYAAMAELCRRPLVYRGVILSLAGLYKEELPIIRAIKRRYPHVEVWLAHTDGRQAALAEGMRLGADGLLDEDGLHRVAVTPAEEASPSHGEVESLVETAADQARGPRAAEPDADQDLPSDEPILSADELKALLQEQPTMPPAGDDQA